MAYPNYDLVDQICWSTLCKAGFVFQDRQGEEQVDNVALKEAVYQRMLSHHVVGEPKGMTKQAVTAHELYASLLPDGPGARRQPETLEETEARDRLKRQLWAFTNTGVTGYVNKRLGTDGLTLVVCEAQVARTFKSQETGRTEPTTQPGRFLTDHPELIANHSTLPQALRLVKAAEACARHMGMAIQRHPELAETITRQIKGALTRSRAALEAPSTKRLASVSQSDDE